VEWHDSSPLRIGEFVVPIGNPFGIGQSVSFGIISAIGRDRVDSGAYVDYIQTDATVNTGNSGGPLFDLEGKVVAVNSAIYSPTGASVGIAFAIPHHTAENVIERLRRDGEVQRGYLGVGLRTGEYNTGRSGAIIDSLVPGGPAQMAGLRVEDIILSVNGTPVDTSVEATRLIGELSPNDKALFRIERNEKEGELTATLTRRPSKENLERAAAGLPSVSDVAPRSQSSRGAPRSEGRAHHVGMANTGLSLVDLSAQFRSAIGMSYDQVGVYVEAVLPGTGAETRGMETGMVLMELETEPVASVDIFRELVAKHRSLGKSEALLKVRLKNGSETYVSLPIV
jgi:serine protease Do